MIVSYLGSPVMFTVTRSLGSVVFTVTPRSTLPPLPATQRESSAMVRSGLVTDGVDVVDGVVSAVDVVGVAGVVDDVVAATFGVIGVVAVVSCVSVVGAAAAPVVMFRLL